MWGKAVIIALCCSAGAQAAQTAAQIMDEVHRRARSENFRYEGRITTRRANGAKEEKAWLCERLGPPGASKMLLRFLDPADIRGVALLIWNHLRLASDREPLEDSTPLVEIDGATNIGRHPRILPANRVDVDGQRDLQAGAMQPASEPVYGTGGQAMPVDHNERWTPAPGGFSLRFDQLNYPARGLGPPAVAERESGHSFTAQGLDPCVQSCRPGSRSDPSHDPPLKPTAMTSMEPDRRSTAGTVAD